MFSWIDFYYSFEEMKSFMPNLKAKFERKLTEEGKAQVHAGGFGLGSSLAILKS